MKYRFLGVVCAACLIFLTYDVYADGFESEVFALERFVAYGILPEVDVDYFDRPISHYGFSDVIRNLTGQPISEKLTFNAGLSPVRYDDAVAVFYALSGHTPPSAASPTRILNFADLILLLDGQIDHFKIDEFEINLRDTPLNGIFLINQLSADSEYTLDSSLFNAHGFGDIVIIPRANSHIFLSGINIYGNIVVLPGDNGYANITLHNSFANAIYINGNASINFVGNNHIEQIYITAGAYINTSGLSPLATVPSITTYTDDLSLHGHFDRVNLNVTHSFSPASIMLDGSIAYLYSHGSVILLGNGTVYYYFAPALNIVSTDDILNQNMQYAFASMLEQLLEHVDYIVWWQVSQAMAHFLQTSPPSSGSAEPPAIFVPTPPDADPAPVSEN